MTRIVVDLPAPFGPTKPVTWPGRTVNDIPSSACADPNRLRSPDTSMVASMARNAAVPGAAVVTRRSGLRQCSSGVPDGACPPRELRADCPARGTRPGRACGDNECHGRLDWLARIATAARHAPAVGCALLAAGRGRPGDRSGGRARPAGPWRPTPVPWLPSSTPCRSCVALAGHGPAALLAPGRGGARDHGGQRGVAGLRSAPPTAAGIAAQVIAGYRLGRPRRPLAAGSGGAAPGRGRRAGGAVRRARPDQPRRRDRRAARLGRARSAAAAGIALRARARDAARQSAAR